MQKINEPRTGMYVSEKVLIAFALGVLLTIAGTASFAEASSYSEYNLSVNMSTLPSIIKKEIEINNNINSTLNINYGNYLSGANGIYFANTAKLKMNVTVDLPELNEGTYNAFANTTFGEKIKFNINIVNDPTIDDFRLTTDQNEYIANESMFITVYAPENTNLSLLIRSKTENKSYNSMVFGSAMLVFVPKKEGNYTITAIMSHKLYNVTLEKTVNVKMRFSCTIKSPLRMHENTTAEFISQIIGGTGPYTYKWNFDDGTYSTSQNTGHAYNKIGSYDIEFSVRDKFNNIAACSQIVEVETIKYAVEIRLTDNITKKVIGDAVIKFDEVEKKSNVKGKAVFDNIENGRHRVVIKRDGYEEYAKSYQINKSISIEIALEAKEADITMLPKVNIKSPENNAEIDNKKLSVLFSVSSLTEISSCKLLVNQIPYLGYKVLDSIDNISSGEKKLSCDMTNADYNIKVSCENKFGISASEKINVKGINFPEEKKEILQIEETSSSPKPEINTVAKAGDGLGKKEIDPAVTEKFDKAINDIKNIEKEFSSYTGTQKDILSFLGYDKKILQYRKEIEDLRKEAVTLEGLSIGKTDYISQKNTILTKMKEIEGKIPSRISIVKKKNFEQKTPTTDQLKTALLEYTSHRGKNLTKSELKFFEKKSAELQAAITVDAEISIVNVEYRSGAVEEYSFVKKIIAEKAGTTGFLLIEMIPKTVAQKIDELGFSFVYEVINEDPIIRIDNVDSNGNNEIMYYVRKSVSFEELMSSTTAVIADPTHPSNKITGFAILSSPAQLLGNTITLVIIFAVIGIIVIRTSYSTIKKKIKNSKYENKSAEKISAEKKVDGKKDWSADGIANGIANGIADGFDNIKSSGRTGIDKMTEFAGSLNNNSNESQKEKLLLYLDNALDYINSGQKEEAFLLYSEILPLYGPQPEELKKELSPIMSHLYNEIELYHFAALIEKAEQEIMDGMYDVGSSLNMEIEDIYNELPEHLIPRVSERYNRFSAMLNLKNFRKDTELRLNNELRRNNPAVEDAIFG